MDNACSHIRAEVSMETSSSSSELSCLHDAGSLMTLVEKCLKPVIIGHEWMLFLSSFVSEKSHSYTSH